VSIIILFSGVELVREALLNITSPIELKLQGIALGTAIFSVIAMYALSQYKLRVGKLIDSQALIADAIHSYIDVFSSLIVVITIAGSILGVFWLDSAGVLVISVMIFKLGIGMARDSVLTLMDAWLDKDSIAKIRENVGSIQGIKRVDEIRLRKSGLVVFGEIEIEIEGDANLKRVEMLS
jgi:cation diffusion facilitator family transporter